MTDQVLNQFQAGTQDDLEDYICLDYDLSPAQVVERIESCVTFLVDQIIQGSLPDFNLSTNNSISFPTEDPPADASTTAAINTSGLRSLAGRHTESADRYARLWHVLQVSHELLSSGQGATQRELHYRWVKPSEVFRSSTHVSEAIQDAVKLIQVPRYSLGITASSKGLVSGSVCITDPTTGDVLNCNTPGHTGQSIPGDIGTIASWSIQSDACCVIVVEKETVFQRLLSGGFCDLVPAVLVTGKGMPDLATRAFLSKLVNTALPAGTPILGLVDWNPAGVAILDLYRYAGAAKMAEASQYAVPQLQWLGARASMLQHCDGRQFQELTARDRAMIPNLSARLTGRGATTWVKEMETMIEIGKKADLEAVYEGCGGTREFVSVVMQALDAKDWA